MRFAYWPAQVWSLPLRGRRAYYTMRSMRGISIGYRALGQTAATQLLIAKGARIDAKDKDNLTPLHMAVFGGHSDIIKLLIDCGAQVNAKGLNDVTP